MNSMTQDWFCTDEYGQDPDYEHSADNDEWSDSEDGEDGHDDWMDIRNRFNFFGRVNL